MNYLPEWKLYLWKRLLIDNPQNQQVKIDDFIIYQEREIIRSTKRQHQYVAPTFDNPHTIYELPKKEQSGKLDSSFFNFTKEDILNAFFELTVDEPSAIAMDNIVITKDYISAYKQKAKEEAARYARIKAVSMTNSANDNGFNESEKPILKYGDEQCGLGESIFKKVESGTPITTDILKNLVNSLYVRQFGLCDFVSFKLTVNAEVLEKKINDYIDAFLQGDLIARYFKAEKQRTSFAIVIKALAGQLGHKNMPIKLQDIKDIANWQNGEEQSYRFYETLFSLERTGDIEIKDLMTNEVIISINPRGLQVLNNNGNLALAKQQPTEVEKKLLCVLKKLKDEWDITPPNQGRGVLRAYTTAHISPRTHAQWQRECGLEDYTHFKNVLEFLRREGLIVHFSFVSEYA